MTVIIGNNSQLNSVNNSRLWAVLSPLTTTTALSSGRPDYRPNTELGISVENCATSAMVFDAKAATQTAAGSEVSGWVGQSIAQRLSGMNDGDRKQPLTILPAVSTHRSDSTARYQLHSRVLRPVKPETSH